MSFADAPRNPLGKASFWLGVAVVAAECLRQVGQAVVLATDNYESLTAYYFVTGLVILALAISALVTGIIALLRPGLPRTFAAVGVALGASSIASALASWLVNIILVAFGG